MANFIIMAEMFNLDGTRTDQTASISMRIWNVTVPETASQSFDTSSLIYIDAGVWAYLSPIDNTYDKTFLFVFENHEDIEDRENFMVTGIMGPDPDDDTKWTLLTAGGVVYGTAETKGSDLKIKLANGREMVIKRRA